MAAPDVWSETGLIAITAKGGSDIEFATLIESIDPDIGAKDFEEIKTLASRLTRFTPQDLTTVTIVGYALEAGTDTGSVGKGFFDLMNTQDVTQPLSIPLDKSRTMYRIVILWTDDTSIASATAAVPLNSTGKRLILQDGYFTQIHPEFTDFVLKYTLTYKCTAFDKSGNANVIEESTDGSIELPAVPAYT